MSREFTCDTCGLIFADRDWTYPVDERKDYCGEECYNAAKAKGVIIDCPTCHADATCLTTAHSRRGG
jgi:hypothetical protein